MAMNVDCQGKQRGRCSACMCDGYDGGSEKKKCIACGHPPGKHQNLSTSSFVSSSSGVSSISALSPPSVLFDGGMTYSSDSDSAVFIPPMYRCQYPGCQKESAFDPNTGAQNEYCLEHIQYTQMLQQASYNAFTTPRWSVGNTDSSDIASSQSDSSDDDQDLSSRVQSDGGSVRPTTSAAAPSLSSSSTNWGVGLASAFTSLFQSQTQRAPSKKTRPQHVSPRKRTQSAGPATAQARPVTAPSQQVHQSITMPQATFMQAQQSILVPQTIPGEINIH